MHKFYNPNAGIKVATAGAATAPAANIAISSGKTHTAISAKKATPKAINKTIIKKEFIGIEYALTIIFCICRKKKESLKRLSDSKTKLVIIIYHVEQPVIRTEIKERRFLKIKNGKLNIYTPIIKDHNHMKKEVNLFSGKCITIQ